MNVEDVAGGSGRETTIIRADERGRLRYSAAYRREVVEGFRASGMSAMAFARHCGLKYPTLAAWVRKERGPAEAGVAGREPRFLLGDVAGADGSAPEACPAGALSVGLPGGAVARAGDAAGVELLAALLRALRDRRAGC